MVTQEIAAYSDTVNAEDLSGVTVGDHNCKYRSWKAQFSPEQGERFDRMIERRLGGSGLEFRCE